MRSKISELNTIEKTEIENLRITSQYPIIKENIILLKQNLLPSQLFCLQYTIKSQKPNTTRQYYVSIVHEFFIREFGHNTSELNEVIENLQNKIKKKYGFENMSRKDIIANLLVDKNIYLLLNQSLMDVENKMKKEVGVKLDWSITNKTAIIEIILRKMKVKFPTYTKISNSLEKLKSFGFLSKIVEDGKTYWTLNNRFFLEFKDKFKDILKLDINSFL